MADLLSLALGSVITVVVGGVVRAPGIPADVRRHDARVASHDASLETWVADRHYTLGRECVSLRDAIPRDGDPEGAAHEPGGRAMEMMIRSQHLQAAAEADRAIADARARALHEYRDQATLVKNDATAILASEGWAHRAYRRAFRKPAPMLTAPDRVAPILAAWRKPSGMNPERWTWPDDATQRTLDDAIRSVPVSGP